MQVRLLQLEFSELVLCTKGTDNIAKALNSCACGMQKSRAESRGTNYQRGHPEDRHHAGHYIGSMATVPSTNCAGHWPKRHGFGLLMLHNLRLSSWNHRRAVGASKGAVAKACPSPPSYPFAGRTHSVASSVNVKEKGPDESPELVSHALLV